MTLAVLAILAPLALVAADETQDRIVRNLMSTAGIPGLEAAVVTTNRIVWEKSFGEAVLKVPGPRRSMRTDTLLSSASMGKLLVTVATLQLVEKGRIRLDDDIDTSLPYAVRNPAWPDVPITWRMLLTHTSSLGDDESDALESSSIFYGGDPTESLEEFVRDTLSPTGAHHHDGLFRPGKPGTERIYNNLAFDLAALAVQRLVGESFDRYIERVILKPLGMSDSSYSLAGRPAARFGVGYASIQNKDHSFRYEPANAFWAHRDPKAPILDHAFTCSDYPSGCMYTTVHDFALLMQMFLGDGSANGVRILTPESVRLMSSPSGFRNLDGWMQGLGMNGPLDLRGRQLWGHDGIDRGVATVFYFSPTTHIGIVAMANANNPDFTLSYSLLDIGMHLMSRFEPL
jgi:CubicO group peptidase (beta-lactamase class C family)